MSTNLCIQIPHRAKIRKICRRIRYDSWSSFDKNQQIRSHGAGKPAKNCVYIKTWNIFYSMSVSNTTFARAPVCSPMFWWEPRLIVGARKGCSESVPNNSYLLSLSNRYVLISCFEMLLFYLKACSCWQTVPRHRSRSWESAPLHGI